MSWRRSAPSPWRGAAVADCAAREGGQWESAEALRAMLAQPDSRPHLQRVTAIGRGDPTVREVVSVHGR